MGYAPRESPVWYP
ncbi:hypothetical protein EC950183_3648, partial [Escherichia coli 95.0183]